MRRMVSTVVVSLALSLAVVPAASASPLSGSARTALVWTWVERVWSFFELQLGKARGMMDPDGRLYQLDGMPDDTTSSTN